MNINYQYTSTYNTPNFQGYSRRLQVNLDKVLIKKNLSLKDKNEIISDISKAVNGIISPEKFIGNGVHNAVYKITRKYVARVPLNFKAEDLNTKSELKIGRNIFSNLKGYFGEAVLQLGNFQILPNVGKHEPAGIPEHLTKYMTCNQLKKYYINKYLPNFANIPQASYNDLVEDIEKLNEIELGHHRYCLFDYLNPNNIVTRKKKLFLVDDIDNNGRSYQNTTAKLFSVFIVLANRFSEAPDAGENTKYVRKIFKKLLIASGNVNMLPATSKDDFDLWKNALRKCKINTEPNEIINFIESTSQYDKPERIRLLNNYINKLFVNNPIK